MGEFGGPLTVIYSSESASPRNPARAAAVLPLLVILFIVSYGILTTLVFEQGQTIESQRSLIREMLKDSTQLAALKGKLARDDGKGLHDKAAVQADHRDVDSSSPNANSNANSNANPNAAAGAKAPDAKGLDKDTKRPSKSAHATREIPGKPAADLEDVRRFTQVI
jgi:hypothetical protein